MILWILMLTQITAQRTSMLTSAKHFCSTSTFLSIIPPPPPPLRATMFASQDLLRLPLSTLFPTAPQAKKAGALISRKKKQPLPETFLRLLTPEQLSGKWIAIDTEATGCAGEDDKPTEIGGIEIINKKITGKKFQKYVDPEREVTAGAYRVTGLTRSFLRQFSPFNENTAKEFLDFIAGAGLIFHDASFDLKLINTALKSCGHPYGKLEEHHHIIDTLVLAKHWHPDKKNNLDALCHRYGVDNSERTKHGALIDAKLTAHVFCEMIQRHIKTPNTDQYNSLPTEKTIAPTKPLEVPDSVKKAIKFYEQSQPLTEDSTAVAYLRLCGITGELPAHLRVTQWETETPITNQRISLLNCVQSEKDLSNRVVEYANAYWRIVRDERKTKSAHLLLKNGSRQIQVLVQDHLVVIEDKEVPDHCTKLFVRHFDPAILIVPYVDEELNITGIERLYLGPHAQPILTQNQGKYSNRKPKGITKGAAAIICGAENPIYDIRGVGLEDMLAVRDALRHRETAQKLGIFAEAVSLTKDTSINCSINACQTLEEIITAPLSPTTKKIIIIAPKNGYNIKTHQILVNTVEHFLTNELAVQIILPHVEKPECTLDFSGTLSTQGLEAACKMLHNAVNIEFKSDLGPPTEPLGLHILRLQLKKQLGQDGTINTLLQLIEVCAKLESRKEEARYRYRKLLSKLQRKEAILGPDILLKIANIELLLDYHNHAFYHYKQSLDKQKSSNTTNPLETAKTLQGLGRIYFKKQKHDKALPQYEASLEMAKLACKAERLPHIMVTLGYMGDAYFKQQNYTQAIAHYEHSIDIAQSIYNTHINLHSVHISHKLGNVYFKQLHCAQALWHYQETLYAMRKLFGIDNHALHAKTLLQIGRTYAFQGKYHSAATYYARYFQTTKTDDLPTVLTALINRANMFAEKTSTRSPTHHITVSTGINRVLTVAAPRTLIITTNRNDTTALKQVILSDSYKKDTVEIVLCPEQKSLAEVLVKGSVEEVILLASHKNRNSWPDVLAAVRHFHSKWYAIKIGISPGNPKQATLDNTVTVQDPEDAERYLHYLQENIKPDLSTKKPIDIQILTPQQIDWYNQAAPASNTLVDYHYREGGISNLPPAIRFGSCVRHPQLDGIYRAVIVGFTDAGHLTGIYIRYLISHEEIEKVRASNDDKFPMEEVFYGQSHGTVELHAENPETLIIGDLPSALIAKSGLLEKNPKELRASLGIERGFTLQACLNIKCLPSVKWDARVKQIILLLNNDRKAGKDIADFKQALVSMTLTAIHRKILLKMVMLRTHADGGISLSQLAKTSPQSVIKRLHHAITIKHLQDLARINILETYKKGLEDAQQSLEYARKIYEASQPTMPNGSTVAYFKRRGIPLNAIPSSFLSHPALYNRWLKKKFPAAIIPLEDMNGSFTGIKVIWFYPNGEALPKHNKMGEKVTRKASYGLGIGSAGEIYTGTLSNKITITEKEPRIVFLSEGVENALVAYTALTDTATHRPILAQQIYKNLNIDETDSFAIKACMGINEIVCAPLGRKADTVIVLADNDVDNADAKRTLRETTQHFLEKGCDVMVVLPQDESDRKADLNDMFLNANGTTAPEKIAEFIRDAVSIYNAEALAAPGSLKSILQNVKEKTDQITFRAYEIIGNASQDLNSEDVTWLKEMAAHRYPAAQACLGFLYSTGIGVSKDAAKTYDLSIKAARQGLADAQNRVGFCYFSGEGVPNDKEQAYKWYKKAADQGHVDAQNSLAYLYLHGIGTFKDMKQARELYQKAAQQGHPDAKNTLEFLATQNCGSE